MGGNFGRIFVVTLEGDRARVEHHALAPAVYRDFIGGVGLAAYLLWRYAPAGVDPLAPDAPLVFAFSPLLGTPLTTTAKLTLACKSPLTGRLNDGLSSSRFALVAKRLGVDAIVITGALRTLSVLHLEPAPARCRVEARPELAGRSPAEVTSILVSEAGGDARPGVAAIGLGGEKLVRYATVSNDGRHAGRGGSGAVMGHKRLKAITVRGRETPGVFAPERVHARARELAARSLGASTDKYRLLGTAANLETFARLRILPARNFQGVTLSRREARRLAPEGLAAAAGHTRASCAGCTIGCDHRYGGTRVEYETQFALGPLCGVEEPGALLEAARVCDELGLDTISAGGTIAFAMECAARGLVDWPLRFGDAPAPWLRRIAAREGAGDKMAEGTRELARAIGQGSARFACHVKGLELPGYEPRAMQTMALGLVVASRGADHNRSGAYQADLRPDVDRYRADIARAPGRVIETEDHAALLDSLILCKFLRGAIPSPWVEGAELLEMVTGDAHDEASLRLAARRIVTLRHHYNLREGWRRDEDQLPARFVEEPLEDGARLSRDDLEAMRDAYYLARGYDERGRVPPACLEAVGLARWLTSP